MKNPTNLIFLACSIVLMSFALKSKAAEPNNLYTPPPGLPVPGVELPKQTNISAPYSQSLYEFARWTFQDFMQVPFLFSPEFVSSQISIAYDKKGLTKENALFILNTMLKRNGFQLQRNNSFYTIEPIPEPAKPKKELFFYKPNYRTVSYLVNNLSGLVEGSFTNSQQSSIKDQGSTSTTYLNGKPTGGSSVTSATSQQAPSKDQTAGTSFQNQSSSQELEVLAFSGVPEQIGLLKSLLEKFDTKPIKVAIRTKFIEVSKVNSSRRGLKVVGDLLGGALKTSITSVGAGTNVITIGTNFQVIADALDSANDISIISEPELVINSGVTKTIKVNSKISYISGTTTTNGTTQTQTNFIEAGTSLTVSATVLNEAIDLELTQEQSEQTQSEFSAPTPSIFQRIIPTKVTIEKGQAVLIGGLKYSKKTNINNSFLGFKIGKQDAVDDKEIVLLIYADVI